MIRSLLRDAPLVLSAIAAFAWVIARAAVQSITIDEAVTFELFVASPDGAQWSAASNNHILNSLLMRLFVSVFGISHLTVRSGALIGAFLYIAAAFILCRWLAESGLRQWAAFICLVCNPFIMDYLVAARGYGLASALLLWMFVAIAWQMRRGGPDSTITACAVCSVLAALSVAANLAFTFVNMFAVAVLALVVCRTLPNPRLKDYAQILAACIVPGLIVSAFLTLHAVLNWPDGQLWWGAKSLKETARSIIEPTLHEPNATIVNPLLYPVARLVGRWLISGVLLVTGVQLAFIIAKRQKSWRNPFAATVVSTLVLTILTHWLLFRMTGMLLPKERTALYGVVLFTLLLITILAFPVTYAARRIACAAVLIAAVYFISCLRLTYFLEWRWNAGVKQAYGVAAWYNHTYGVERVESSWHYSAVLNFYRRMSRQETFGEVTGNPSIPAGQELYVLHGTQNRDFIEAQRLRIVHRGEADIVVAIDPALETRPRLK